ncbi:MAG: formylglycine-generating enzyme family protein [Candidatus Aminicenantes bacterium]|nr:formylglycine-generating enzyme family protein [Candidatus Aminicenantes bacterium]
MRRKNLYMIAILGIFLIGISLYITFIILKSRKPAPLETKTIQIKNIRLEMVYIPAGEFHMGSTGGWIDEQPLHRVRITRGFWMGKTEVTQGLWKTVMNNNPSGFARGDQYPVERVSWEDCQRFIHRLTELTNITFRLPTEAEWEYACRAGTRVEYPQNLDDLAWYDRNSNQSTHPVGLKQPNAFGLLDMLGNVWEWCADRYEKNYYSRSPLNDPRGPVIGTHRVDRGGGWAYNTDIVRPSRRDGSGSDYATDLIGFRLVADHIP